MFIYCIQQYKAVNLMAYWVKVHFTDISRVDRHILQLCDMLQFFLLAEQCESSCLGCLRGHRAAPVPPTEEQPFSEPAVTLRYRPHSWSGFWPQSHWDQSPCHRYRNGFCFFFFYFKLVNSAIVLTVLLLQGTWEQISWVLHWKDVRLLSSLLVSQGSLVGIYI